MTKQKREEILSVANRSISEALDLALQEVERLEGVLQKLKETFESRAAKAREIADADWPQHVQKDRAMAESVSYLWCANEIDVLLTADAEIKA